MGNRFWERNASPDRHVFFWSTETPCQPSSFPFLPANQPPDKNKSDLGLGFRISDNTHNVEVEFGPNRSVHRFFLGKPHSMHGNIGHVIYFPSNWQMSSPLFCPANWSWTHTPAYCIHFTTVAVADATPRSPQRTVPPHVINFNRMCWTCITAPTGYGDLNFFPSNWGLKKGPQKWGFPRRLRL